MPPPLNGNIKCVSYKQKANDIDLLPLIASSLDKEKNTEKLLPCLLMA